MGAYPGWARMGGWRLHKGKTQDVYPLPRSCLTKLFTNLTYNTLNLNKYFSITHTLKGLMDSCWLLFKLNFMNYCQNICFLFINHHIIPKRKERSEILWKRVTNSDYREVTIQDCSWPHPTTRSEGVGGCFSWLLWANSIVTTLLTRIGPIAD